MHLIMQPQEIEVWFVLPAIRRELAKSLINYGLTQKQIAEKLGVTDAAISQYLNSKRAKEISFDKELNKRIKESAKKIIDNNYNLVEEIQNICELFKKRKLMCKIHKKHGTTCTCKICLYEK